MSIDVEDLDDEHEQRHDFRRANGAPLVKNLEGKTERYSRPSGYAKPLDDEHALTNWRIFKAMDGVARSKALQAGVIAVKDDDRTEKGRLRELALDRGEANERADLGTGLHAMTVRAEDDTDVDFDPGPHREDLDAYMECLSAYGLRSEMIEVPFVNDEYRAAGTADRVYRLLFDLVAPNGEILPAGTLVLGDLKTGASLDFSVPAYCVQLALYATGTLYDVIDERRLPTPTINKDWSLLVHLPVGKARCTLLWCSIEIGLYGAWLAYEVKKWQAAWKRGDHDVFEVPKPDMSLPMPMTEILAEQGIGATVVMSEDMVPEMMAYCLDRIRAIGGHAEARQFMLLQWPDGLPTPKQGGHTPAQMVQLLDLLDQVEKKFSLPFLRDPRVDMQLGVHKSKVDRTNEYLLTTT
jgi:hypothetical protein